MKTVCGIIYQVVGRFTIDIQIIYSTWYQKFKDGPYAQVSFYEDHQGTRTSMFIYKWWWRLGHNSLTDTDQGWRTIWFQNPALRLFRKVYLPRFCSMWSGTDFTALIEEYPVYSKEELNWEINLAPLRTFVSASGAQKYRKILFPGLSIVNWKSSERNSGAFPPQARTPIVISEEQKYLTFGTGKTRTRQYRRAGWRRIIERMKQNKTYEWITEELHDGGFALSETTV